MPQMNGVDVARGLTNQDIAKQFGITENTSKAFRDAGSR